VLQIEAFWRSLGSRVLRMTPDAHDAAVAAVSHTPHLVASALAAATPAEHLPLAGAGWSDTTRVAAGDAALWRQILLQNRRHVLRTLDDFAQALHQLRQALDTEDAQQLEQLLETGKQTRNAYPSGSSEPERIAQQFLDDHP
jgi:prephenate dehydrogenase